LVNHFYGYVHQDALLAPVFKLEPEQWANHLNRTCSFWENWLFQTGNYGGGLMWAHLEKNQTHPFQRAHFEHWLSIWFGTVDELFAGPRAEFIKSKALEVGNWMFGRIHALNQERLPKTPQ
jgi:hemoglobin